MSERLEAQVQTRIFYFVVVNQKENELSISMYNTPYTFVKNNGVWLNHSNNKMNMSRELIDAVIAASYQPA